MSYPGSPKESWGNIERQRLESEEFNDPARRAQAEARLEVGQQRKRYRSQRRRRRWASLRARANRGRDHRCQAFQRAAHFTSFTVRMKVMARAI